MPGSTKIRRKDLKAMAKKHTSNFITKDNIWKGIEKPISLKYINIGKLLLDRMKAKPDFIDVVTEETYTFTEMFDRTVKCALWLRQERIKANDVVTVCSSNIMNSFILIYLSSNFYSLEHNNRYKYMSLLFNFFDRYQQNNRNFLISLFSGEARFFMKLSREKIVSTEESLVDSLIEAAKLENHDIKIVVFDKALNAIPFSKILQDHRKCDANNFECTSVNNVHDTAIIAYSSGTTGFPKGVQIFHYSCLYALKLNSTINYCIRLLYPKFDEEMMCKIIEKYKIIKCNVITTYLALRLSLLLVVYLTRKIKGCLRKI
ncbi:4-coumarate--CoA ligase 1-like [Vespula maculifrons]|uniref:4-coumarate--CoA ligase 1-like n=1 Tax=Vespula maculifrons TaxID=7453 RepID=A0ABD2CRH0_VESMC